MLLWFFHFFAVWSQCMEYLEISIKIHLKAFFIKYEHIILPLCPCCNFLSNDWSNLYPWFIPRSHKGNCKLTGDIFLYTLPVSIIGANLFCLTVLLLLADPSDLTLTSWVNMHIYWQINSLKQAVNELATYVHLTTDASPFTLFFKCIKY